MESNDLLERMQQRMPLLDELWTLANTGSFRSFLRTEIAKEVETRLQVGAGNLPDSSLKQLTALNSDLKTLRVFVEDETRAVQESISDLRSREPLFLDRVSTLAASVSDISSDLIGLKADVDQKPNYREVTRLNDKLMNCVTRSEFETLETSLQRCVEKEEMKRLEEKCEDLSSVLEDYSTLRATAEAMDKLELDVKAWIKPLALTTDLDRELSSVNEAFSKAVAKQESLQKQLTSDFQILKKEFNDMKSAFERAPWRKEQAFLTEELGKKATRLEIRQFKEDGTQILHNADAKMKEMTETLQEFDSVLQHYDEIFLLKASRDDLKSLQQKFDAAIDTSAIKSELETLKRALDTLQDDKNTIETTVSKLQTSLEILVQAQQAASKSEAQIDISAVFNSISEIRDRVSVKADRTDVYGLKESKSEKQEMELISGDLHTLRKQVESLAGTLYGLIKGYVDEEPSSLLAEKQRNHLLGHSLSLLNWISGADAKTNDDTDASKRPRTRTLSIRKKAFLGNTLPQVQNLTTPKRRPRTRKESQSSIYSPSKTFLDSARM